MNFKFTEINPVLKVARAWLSSAFAIGFFLGNFSWASQSSQANQAILTPSTPEQFYLSAVKTAHQEQLSPAKLIVLKEGQLAEMLTWTPYHYDLGSQVLTHEVWVVEAAQMKAHCQDLSGERINQLLGMPPYASNQDLNKSHFELIQVPVTPYVFVKNKLQAEIIRPCFSSGDVSTDSCHYVPNNFANNSPQTSLSPYQQWIKAIDTETANYPWTGLGYTYDWSPDNPSHVGLSEFILPVGSQVVVEKSINPQEFCSKVN